MLREVVFFSLISSLLAWDSFTDWMTTQKEPVRGSWLSTAVVVSSGDVATLSLKMTGEVCRQYHVVFLRNGDFFQRITSTDRIIHLKTALEGNYTVKHIWNEHHLPAQVPGQHIFTAEEQQRLEEDSQTVPFDACCAIVKFKPRPSIVVAPHFCKPPIVAHLDGYGPLELTFFRVGQASKSSLRVDGPGEVKLDVSDVGVYQLSLRDTRGSISPVQTVHLHQQPQALLNSRGDATVCHGESAHIELNLTRGEPPWEFKVGFVDSVSGESEVFALHNRSDRVVVLPATRPGEYTLLDVHDAFCEGEAGEVVYSRFRGSRRTMKSATVSISPPVLADLQEVVDEGCEGKMTHVNVTLAGHNPFNFVLLRDGSYHRRQELKMSCALGEYCRDVVPILLVEPGEYTVGDATDAKWCDSRGSTKATIVRHAPPSMSLSVSDFCVNSSVPVSVTGLPPFVLHYTIIPRDAKAAPISRSVVLCADNNATEGAMTCNWHIPPSSPAGTYVTDSISDGRGCAAHTIRSRFSFTVYSTPTVRIETFPPKLTCSVSKSDVVLRKEGGGGQLWSVEMLFTPKNGGSPVRSFHESRNPTLTLHVQAPGSYEIIAARDELCTTGLIVGKSTFTIDHHTPPTAALYALPNSAHCKEGMIGINFTGQAPWRFKLADDSKELTTGDAHHKFHVSAGIYKLDRVVDGFGCAGTVSGTANVTLPSESKVRFINNLILKTCPGGKVKLRVGIRGDGPFSLALLHNNAPFLHTKVTGKELEVEVQDAGVYQVASVLDGHSCPGLVPAKPTTVIFSTPPSIVSLSMSQVCTGQTVRAKLNGEPPFTLTVLNLQNGDRSIVRVPFTEYDIPVDAYFKSPGSYKVLDIRDSNGCLGVGDATLQVHPEPELVIASSSAENLGFGEGVTLFARLVNGTPPWKAELVSESVGLLASLTDPPERFLVQSVNRELSLGNRPGFRSWAVAWVEDESGCVRKYSARSHEIHIPSSAQQGSVSGAGMRHSLASHERADADKASTDEKRKQ